MDKVDSLDIHVENVTQSPDKCSGSPKMTTVQSRKGLSQMERDNNEDVKIDIASKGLVIRVSCLQLDQSRLPSVPNKAPAAIPGLISNAAGLLDLGDGKNKRFNRFTTIRPIQVFLFFALMSTIGTLILICFTLAIKRKNGDH